MQKNILEYLEGSLAKYSDKTAFSDESGGLTYKQLYDKARNGGSFLLDAGYNKEPVFILMQRSPEAIAAFFSALYAGCFYVPLDIEQPKARIKAIFESVNGKAIICDEACLELAKGFGFSGEIYLFSQICRHKENPLALEAARSSQLDSDPAYVVFTSGSSGAAKGVAASHRNVIDYTDSLSRVLAVNDSTVFGMQAPLFVDACLKEIYPALKHGASTVLIPKKLFMFPIPLIEFMNSRQINTICWVSSALAFISGSGALEKHRLSHLRTVAFGGEVFSPVQLAVWQKAQPGSRFINLYGPTECTGMSCYYEVPGPIGDNEAIPIGRPFPNTGVFLLNEKGQEITGAGEEGELYIKGAGVTLGYYNNKQLTDEVFIQNPLNGSWAETVYKSGDMAKYNSCGELLYSGRKDSQIKHLGYRIELLEIEMAAGRHKGVENAACVYLKEKKRIALFYSGDVENTPCEKEMLALLKESLPSYMLPAFIKRLDKMPRTGNGKIDRLLLCSLAGG